MDRRFFLAILLTAVVVFTVPRLFPTPPRPTPVASDTTRPVPADTTPAQPTPAPTVAAAPPVVAADSSAPPPAGDTLTIPTAVARYAFSTVGAKPLQIVLAEYESLADSGQ